MFRAAPTDWLASVRNALAHGILMQDDDQFHHLARGFVGCNFVIDVVDFLAAALRGDDRPLVGPVTPRHLHRWLGGDDWEDDGLAPAALADPDAARAFNDGPGGPWARINAWAALEAVLRHAAPQVSVAAFARDQFAEALTESVFRREQQCSQRAPQVLDAFARWWAAFVPPLADCLAPDRWRDLAALAWMDDDALRPRLAEPLLDAFGTDHVRALGDLLRWKQWQLERCVQQLNAPLPPLPVSWDDIEEIVAGLDDARRAGRAFRYARAQRRALASLLQWAQQAGLAALHGVRADRFAPMLDADPSVKAPDVPAHLADWGPLLRAARMRRLPPDWGDHRPLEDLLACPLPGAFWFAPWRSRARAYGLAPAD